MAIKHKSILFLLLIVFILPVRVFSQITAVGYDATAATSYFPSDDIFIYCAGSDSIATLGELVATSSFVDASEFKWEKYDTFTGMFSDYSGGVQTSSATSQLSDLGDGLYRVTITQGTQSTTAQAWILHDWIIATAEIPDTTSVCEYFEIVASYKMASLTYVDPNTQKQDSLRNSDAPSFVWKDSENTKVSTTLSPTIYDPPASNNDVPYTLTVTDNQFGCTGTYTVKYDSKTTSADFTADPMAGEAVLKVTFTNSSINYDSTYWFFSKSMEDIAAEIAANGKDDVDSTDFILTDDSPVYEYETCGTYKVHLVTVKVNLTTGNCYDTTYISEAITVEDPFVNVPNFFTPNGDGTNDEFVVQTQSLKSMSIKIYNRWGGLVHSWKYGNIRSNEYTNQYSVWDGRIGNRMASPGVYFYVIQYVGRDGEAHRKDGFFHLFRPRD